MTNPAIDTQRTGPSTGDAFDEPSEARTLSERNGVVIRAHDEATCSEVVMPSHLFEATATAVTCVLVCAIKTWACDGASERASAASYRQGRQCHPPG